MDPVTASLAVTAIGAGAGVASSAIANQGAPSAPSIAGAPTPPPQVQTPQEKPKKKPGQQASLAGSADPTASLTDTSRQTGKTLIGQ